MRLLSLGRAGTQAARTRGGAPTYTTAGARSRAHHACEPLALEVERGAVLCPEALDHPVGEHLPVGAAALGLGVEVDAVAEREEAEPLHGPGRPMEGGDGLGEPAQRSRAQAAEDDAALPGLPKGDVEAMGAPGAEHAHHAAPADVDQVACEQLLVHVAGRLLAAEERHVRRLAAGRVEGAVEADDVVVGVTARGRQEADLRPLLPGQTEHVVVEQRVAALHREAAAAEGHDLTHRATVRGRPAAVNEFQPSVEWGWTGGPG
jgi:hypothetical protein